MDVCTTCRQPTVLMNNSVVLAVMDGSGIIGLENAQLWECPCQQTQFVHSVGSLAKTQLTIKMALQRNVKEEPYPVWETRDAQDAFYEKYTSYAGYLEEKFNAVFSEMRVDPIDTFEACTVCGDKLEVIEKNLFKALCDAHGIIGLYDIDEMKCVSCGVIVPSKFDKPIARLQIDIKRRFEWEKRKVKPCWTSMDAMSMFYAKHGNFYLHLRHKYGVTYSA